MLKMIAVQVTGLSNVGHDTGLAAIFGSKNAFQKIVYGAFSFRFDSFR